MRLRLSVLSSLLLTSLSVQADPGRVNFSATQSNISIFNTESMLPVWSNGNHMTYADLAGGYGTDDTYVVSPGLGYRGIYHNQIFGAGLFADYERTSLGENFWVMSPGVEWMSAHWDAHVNGYFPIQSRQQTGSQNWADNFGIYEYGDPHGNSFDNALITPYTVIGNGVDTEVGYSFDQGDHLRSRIFLGGYYYHPQEVYDVGNINGATAGFTKALSKKFTVSLVNSYDNLNHYTLGISLTATFGGDSNTYSDNVEDRMLDLVDRHVGIIGTGAGAYDQQSYQVTGFGTEHDNVEYVSPNGTGVGTYEDPAPLTQDSLNAFNEQFADGSLIFVQGGTNANYELTSTLSLYSDQNIYGRTEDYKAPAASDEQPKIQAFFTEYNDGFNIMNGVNTISDITILGQEGSGSGIYIAGNSDVTLSNVNVSGFISGGTAGVYAYNTADLLELNIINSTFNSNAAGIYASNVGSTSNLMMNISNSSANYNTNNGLTLWNNIDGGAGTATATLIVNNSQFLNAGTTSGNTGIVMANGSDGSITATLNNVTASGNRSSGLEIVNNTDGGDGEGTGTGDGVVTVTVENSTFSNNGGNPGSEGPGIYIANNGPGRTSVNVYNSLVSNNGQYGVSIDNAQPADTVQSIIDVNLAGTSFINNEGGYAIFGAANAGTSTTIDYSDTSFVGNTPTNQDTVDGENITWIS